MSVDFEAIRRQHRVVGRRRGPRSDAELAGAAGRFIRALGSRCATADPDSVRHLLALQREVEHQLAYSVQAWRQAGFSDSKIGAELGVSKQAVQRRWPR